MALQAVIFDVDGTLADTETNGHRLAFNDAFAAHGLDISWTPEACGRLLAIADGRRRIAHDLRVRGFGARAGRLAYGCTRRRRRCSAPGRSTERSARGRTCPS